MGHGTEIQDLFTRAMTAIEKKDTQGLFVALHTLKGLAGLQGLQDQAATLHVLEGQLMDNGAYQDMGPIITELKSAWPDAGRLELLAPNWGRPWEVLGQHMGKKVQVQGSCQVRASELPLALSTTLLALVHHLVANAVAHGIEMPRERKSMGKAAVGSIRASIAYGQDGLSVLVEDDGRGLLGQGDSDMPPVFWAYGRGKGLEVIRHLAKDYDGECRLSSSPGRGSRFEIVLRKISKIAA